MTIKHWHIFSLIVVIIVCIALLFAPRTSIIQFSPQEKEIVVVIPSYNNQRYYKQNLDSVLTQNYTNYKVIYIDDCSPDGTGNLVESYLKEKDQNRHVTLIKNKDRCGALANIYNAIHSANDSAIIATLDGDDWLAHQNVLATINSFYSQHDIWLTYGQYRCSPFGIKSCCEPLSPEVIANKAYRENLWVTSHLRTFYAWLFKQVKQKDLLYQDKFFAVTWDMAFMFPMLEMAGTHSKFIPEVLYIYNTTNPINDYKVHLELQLAMNDYIRGKEKYMVLEKVPTQNVFS